MSTALVGSIVGPISSRTSSSTGLATWTNTDAGYTFAVGGIPFNLAPTDNNPYQRATAQFRKQQFDNAQTPGDQSIDGYWLRGQFSFHQGSGVRYYDATPDTDYRFWDSVNAAIHEPGKVQLNCSWVEETFVTDGSKNLSGYNGGTGETDGFIWYKNIANGKLARRNFSGVNTDVSAIAITDFAPDPNPGGYCYYIAGASVYTSNGNSVIYTGPSNFTAIWWAKDRLFLLDSAGRWYAKTAFPTGAPVALTAADAFWTGITTSSDWRVADSPGAVFLANRRSIYSVLLDSNGAVPTVTAPVVAALLPQNENIRALTHYLGKVIVVSSRGVRVCESDAASGRIELGPQSIIFSSSKCQSLSTIDTHVFFTGKRTTDSNERIFRIDLAQQHQAGTYAYVTEKDIIPTGAAGVQMVQFVDGPTLYADTYMFDTDGTVYRRTLVQANETGWLETGYIRLGTMEPKMWHSAKVKLEGTEGSVAVAVVRRGGSEEVIANLQATAFVEQDIKLNLPEPEEFIALKFYLTAGPNAISPTLLGYQVRALPAPTRSRMIQVPLMCYDQESFKNGTTRGHKGWAWERLVALEEMERNAGEIMYQDFRTGEQGRAFIEQIAFVNTTAPKGTGDGFGGILTVTLREIT